MITNQFMGTRMKVDPGYDLNDLRVVRGPYNFEYFRRTICLPKPYEIDFILH